VAFFVFLLGAGIDRHDEGFADFHDFVKLRIGVRRKKSWRLFICALTLFLPALETPLAFVGLVSRRAGFGGAVVGPLRVQAGMAAIGRRFGYGTVGIGRKAKDVPGRIGPLRGHAFDDVGMLGGHVVELRAVLGDVVEFPRFAFVTHEFPIAVP
jgi:hypothetical protein